MNHPALQALAILAGMLVCMSVLETLVRGVQQMRHWWTVARMQRERRLNTLRRNEVIS